MKKTKSEHPMNLKNSLGQILGECTVCDPFTELCEQQKPQAAKATQSQKPHEEKNGKSGERGHYLDAIWSQQGWPTIQPLAIAGLQLLGRGSLDQVAKKTAVGEMEALRKRPF